MLIALMVIGVCGVAIACEGEKPDNSIDGSTTGGSEIGVYYCAVSGEDDYLLTLSDNFKTILIMGDDTVIGTYSLSEDKTLTLKLGNNFGNAVGALSANSISITIEVLNGKTISKPSADPTRDGFAFVGWYKDKGFGTPFLFGTEAITAPTTIYARWVKVEDGSREFTVNFDLNYTNAPEIASKQTLGGMLFDVVQPQRENYTFNGWWVSMTGNRDELSYKVEEETKFYESMTVYALWQNNTINSKLPTPVVNVTDSGFGWESVGTTVNGYNATVEWTLDYGLWAVRTIYASYQRNMNITVGSSGLRLIYLYDAAMSDILRKADPVMWWFVYSNFKNMPEVIVDNSLLIEAMTAYRNLEPIKKSLFSALEAGNNLYYNGILVACSKSLSKSSMPVAEQLLVAELYYTMYQRSPDGSDNQGVSYLSKFIAEAEKLKEDYEALEASEKTLFDNIFKAAYDYYVAESERLSADNAGSGESSPELAA